MATAGKGGREGGAELKSRQQNEETTERRNNKTKKQMGRAIASP